MLLPALFLALYPLLQTDAQPPDRTLPPLEAKVVATVQGRGVQVYTCSLQDEKPGWVLQGPEATLTRSSDGTPVGSHSAGPSWHWKDGSAVAGTVVASTPAQGNGNIATLLLETFPLGNTRGFLSNVLWVRRAGASGGVAPGDGCNGQHLNAVVRVPYTATYTFYTGSMTP